MIRKPKKPTETDWFPITSVGFDWEFHKSKISVSVGQHLENRLKPQDDIHNAYTKLYKVFEKHEKLYKLATRKLSEVELEREELSTKVDEANQTIRALRFENNFLAEKTKKLDAELFQVRVQLERTSSAKLDEMFNF